MDDVMMKVVAITQIFPDVGTLFINSKLQRISTKHLQVLTYLFEIPKNKKHLLKSKKSKIQLLTECYYSFATTNKYDEEIRSHLTKIYQGLMFNPFEPNQEPNTRLLRQCADLVYTEMTDNSSLYFQITTWIARKIEEFHTSRLNFLKSQEFVPHMFDIFCIVQDPSEAQEEMQNQNQENECPICQEEITNQANWVETICHHKFCQTCIAGQLEAASKVEQFREPTCALCRTPMATLYFNNYKVAEPIHNKYMVEENLLMTVFTV
jgi:hypothetical protein